LFPARPQLKRVSPLDPLTRGLVTLVGYVAGKDAVQVYLNHSRHGDWGIWGQRSHRHILGGPRPMSALLAVSCPYVRAFNPFQPCFVQRPFPGITSHRGCYFAVNFAWFTVLLWIFLEFISQSAFGNRLDQFVPTVIDINSFISWTKVGAGEELSGRSSRPAAWFVLCAVAQYRLTL
jgi:hypothetical protein